MGAVNLSNSFDVDGPALLICLVVAVRVVLLDLPALVEVESVDDAVHVLTLSPLDEITPHFLYVVKHEFPCPAETQQVVVIVVHLAQITQF